MTTQEVADQLMDYCRSGQWEKAQSELYADHCVSIEMPGTNFPERIEGLEGIKAKGAQWATMVETMHGMDMQGPLVAGDWFSCTMNMDITMKGMDRMQNAEICVFQVADGKIVKEQFFYPLG